MTPSRPVAGFLDNRGKTRTQRDEAAVAALIRSTGAWAAVALWPLLGALLGALLAIQHIGAGDLVVFAAHQSQFDLVLDVLDVEGAASFGPPGQAAENLLA